MCVALPGRVEWIGQRSAISIPGRVLLGDSRLDVDLLLVPAAAIGDHVIVHSGYAISIVPSDAAAESLALLNE
jgi:hydrogenase expression/formation protein HypC